MKLRRQVTLFLDQKDVIGIEAARAKWNPEQYQLIKAHITLIRDEKVKDFTEVVKRVERLQFPCFQVSFGDIERFYDGKGVFIPVLDPSGYLTQLRRKLSVNDFDYDPHVTIMHPRNSRCTDETFTQLLKEPFPFQAGISSVSVIEQSNNSKWQITHQIELI